MNTFVRQIAIASALSVFSLPVSAEPQKGWAVVAPHAQIVPEPSLVPPCTGDYCTLKAIPDLWKRDALKRERPAPMNANNIILERARFQKEVERFGDPHAAPVFNYDILGSGICITGLVLHTC
jgi:hypothetical protein